MTERTPINQTPLLCRLSWMMGILLVFSIVAAPAARAARSSPGSQDLSELVKKVKSGEGFTGSFVQRLEAPGNPATRAEGSLVYKAPGLMILHYTTPPGQWLKLDGTRMSLYVPQNRQVLLKTIKKHRIPETPAILLASIPEITKWFYVRPEETGHLRRGEKVSIVLIPRHPDPHLAQARLTLLKGEGILTDLEFMEQNGTRLSISLTKFNILTRIPQSALSVDVPAGTTTADVPGAF